ncbi:MAG: HIT domain-containing protein [Acidobacteria bacterium]|nr:MAG: HIT domain-containing protein [Acidobacteriota bacterium]
MLNRYPYNGGHAMVAPREHCGDLEGLPPESRAALIDAAARCCAAMRRLWRPDGFNLGFNIGRAAGAGIPEHVHLHVVPRWEGDTNFMTTAGGSRVVSTDLARLHRELRAAIAGSEAP